MNNYLNRLSRVTQNLTPNFRKYTKLRFSVNDEDRYKALKKGYWHTPLYASKGYDLCGFRLNPSQNSEKWETVKLYDFQKAVTISPDLSSFFFMFLFANLRHGKIFDLTKTNFGVIAEDFELLHTEYSGIDGYKNLSDFIQQSNFIDFQNEEDLYKKMLIACFGEIGMNYITMLERALKEEDYFPSVQILEQQPLFRTRLKHMVALKASKAYINNQKSKNTYYPNLWSSFEDSHAHDIEPINFRFLPDDVAKMEFVVKYYTSLLSSKESIIEDIQVPLHTALISLNPIESTKRYIGVQHMEAAAIYDIEYKDPLRSWNCLVNAAYWSGVNRKETLLPAWDAAIFLAETNGWIDVHNALVNEKDFYLAYKRKNNIP